MTKFYTLCRVWQFRRSRHLPATIYSGLVQIHRFASSNSPFSSLPPCFFLISPGVKLVLQLDETFGKFAKWIFSGIVQRSENEYGGTADALDIGLNTQYDPATHVQFHWATASYRHLPHNIHVPTPARFLFLYFTMSFIRPRRTTRVTSVQNLGWQYNIPSHSNIKLDTKRW